MILSKGDHRARAIRAYLYRTHGCPVSTVTLCSRGESDMSLLAGNPLRKIKTFFVCLCFAIQWQLYQHHFEVVLQKAGREQGLLECLLGQTEQQHTAYLQSLHFSCFILNNYFFFFFPTSISFEIQQLLFPQLLHLQRQRDPTSLQRTCIPADAGAKVVLVKYSC